MEQQSITNGQPQHNAYTTMKITTAKIIRELEKKGWHNYTGTLNEIEIDLIRDVRNVIDEILKEKKGITIKK